MDKDVLARAEAIAPVVHEALSAFARTQGEPGFPAWADAPDWMREATLDGVVFRLRAPHASLAAQHDRWTAHMAADGWKPGPVKDAEAKTHPMMTPYDALPEAEKRKDALFAAVVDALAGPLG